MHLSRTRSRGMKIPISRNRVGDLGSDRHTIIRHGCLQWVMPDFAKLQRFRMPEVTCNPSITPVPITMHVRVTWPSVISHFTQSNSTVFMTPPESGGNFDWWLIQIYDHVIRKWLLGSQAERIHRDIWSVPEHAITSRPKYDRMVYHDTTFQRQPMVMTLRTRPSFLGITAPDRQWGLNNWKPASASLTCLFVGPRKRNKYDDQLWTKWGTALREPNIRCQATKRLGSPWQLQ